MVRGVPDPPSMGFGGGWPDASPGGTRGARHRTPWRVGLAFSFLVLLLLSAGPLLPEFAGTPAVLRPLATYVLTINSNPAGVAIAVDGSPHVTPFAVALSQGKHTLKAPSTVAAFHVNYGFRKWDDGGTTAQRTITLNADTRLRIFYSSPKGVVVGDAQVAHRSMGIPAAQKLFQDDYGNYVAVYVDETWHLSIVACNGRPDAIGWDPPFKSSILAIQQATVWMGSGTLRALIQSASPAKQIQSAAIRLTYDASHNVVAAAVDSPVLIDGGPSYTPAAIRAHDGSVWAVWSKTGLNHTKLVAGHFDSNNGWRVQDIAVDPAETKPMYPAIIQRPDTRTLYVFANHDSGSANPRMAFNAARFANGLWTWGTANLNYDGSTSRSLPDAPDVDWDPTRNLVVVEHDRSQESRYAVFTLDASDVKAHVDTPFLDIDNNEWGALFVDGATGDYVLLFIDTSSRNGPLRYLRRSGGTWGAVQTLDSATDLGGITLRKDVVGSKEFLIGKGAVAPVTILYRAFGA